MLELYYREPRICAYIALLRSRPLAPMLVWWFPVTSLPSYAQGGLLSDKFPHAKVLKMSPENDFRVHLRIIQ